MSDDAERVLRAEGFGTVLEQPKAHRWWERPVYWRHYDDEPQYIGDVLLMMFFSLLPVFAIAICVANLAWHGKVSVERDIWSVVFLVAVAEVLWLYLVWGRNPR